MFKELLKEVPTVFKVFWAASAVIGLSLTVFAVWAVYTVVMYITAGG